MPTVTASKDNNGNVVEGKFSISTTQHVEWASSYQGSGNQGNDFWLTEGSLGNTADIQLTNNVQATPNGKKLLTPGEYSIGIKLGAMGPGTYGVKFS